MSFNKGELSTTSHTWNMEDEQSSRNFSNFQPTIKPAFKLLDIEKTLQDCNIVVDTNACKKCEPLLKILKRKLKVQ